MGNEIKRETFSELENVEKAKTNGSIISPGNLPNSWRFNFIIGRIDKIQIKYCYQIWLYWFNPNFPALVNPLHAFVGGRFIFPRFHSYRKNGPNIIFYRYFNSKFYDDWNIDLWLFRQFRLEYVIYGWNHPHFRSQVVSTNRFLFLEELLFSGTWSFVDYSQNITIFTSLEYSKSICIQRIFMSFTSQELLLQ